MKSQHELSSIIESLSEEDILKLAKKMSHKNLRKILIGLENYNFEDGEKETIRKMIELFL